MNFVSNFRLLNQSYSTNLKKKNLNCLLIVQQRPEYFEINLPTNITNNIRINIIS